MDLFVKYISLILGGIVVGLFAILSTWMQWVDPDYAPGLFTLFLWGWSGWLFFGAYEIDLRYCHDPETYRAITGKYQWEEDKDD